MNEIKICTAGDSSLLIEFGQEISPEINAQITAVVRLIDHGGGTSDQSPAHRRRYGHDTGFRVSAH